MARTGRPTKKAADLSPARRKGMRRFSIEVDEAVLKHIDAAAEEHGKKRNAEIRDLLNEALAARDTRTT